MSGQRDASVGLVGYHLLLGNQPVFVVHAYPNDADAIFCQACGVLTLLLVPAVALGRGTVDDKV